MKYFEKYPIIMIVIGVLGVSFSSIFVKLSTAPSAVTAQIRLLWTVLLMSPVVWGKREVRQELLQVDKKSLVLSAFSGLFLAFHFLTWFESLQHTSVASAATIGCTEVIWVALGYCLFMKGKISKKAMGIILFTFVGSILIAYVDSSEGGVHLLGDFLALASAVLVAVYTLLGREVRKKVSTSVYTYVVYVVCAVTLFVVCMSQGYEIFSYGINVIIVGFLLAVFSTILGHSIFSWCLKYFSPAFVSASKLCEPVIASIIAVFLFGELPTIIQIIGGAMIIGGVYCYSQIEKSEEKYEY